MIAETDEGVTALMGIFGSAPDAGDQRRGARMLAAMSRRGADCAVLRPLGMAVLGVARHAWELDAGFGGPVLLAQDEELAVAADASLYYAGDLARRLRAHGAPPAEHTPAHLILAAYRAWGDECTRWLEGDYAFIVWDRRTRTVFAARDAAGTRPLFHAFAGDALLLASTIDGLTAHPECNPALDPGIVAEEAAGLTGAAAETCWRGVSRIAPGQQLLWRPGERLRIWAPPTMGGDVRDGMAAAARPRDAVEELRALLGEAVAERLPAGGRTLVHLGDDRGSATVFSAGKLVLEEARDGRSLDAVSAVHPGDAGASAPILAVLDRWKTPATWVGYGSSPSYADALARAALRAEPMAHPLDAMHQTLARTACALGGRVVLDGRGGESLLHASPLHLASLARRGRWVTLAREWRARSDGATGGAGAFARAALLPAIPLPLLRAVVALDGRALDDVRLERPLPGWLRADFARRHGLAERERRHVRECGRRAMAAHEMPCRLARPAAGRMAAAAAAFALEAGVECRSPLLDARLVRFLAAHRGEGERFLRAALRHVLPEAALAPRVDRAARMHRRLGALARALAAVVPQPVREGTMLAELGIAEPRVLARAWADAERGEDERRDAGLLLALDAELWLRAYAGAGEGRSATGRLRVGRFGGRYGTPRRTRAQSTAEGPVA